MAMIDKSPLISWRSLVLKLTLSGGIATRVGRSSPLRITDKLHLLLGLRGNEAPPLLFSAALDIDLASRGLGIMIGIGAGDQWNDQKPLQRAVSYVTGLWNMITSTPTLYLASIIISLGMDRAPA